MSSQSFRTVGDAHIMESLPAEINIISLNCWGLKFISTFHKERLTEIGKRIASAKPVPNVVGLQECWTQEDYRSIRCETKHILPYGKFYFSGIFGGGLAILSKWPIEESSMFRYPLNGRPTAFYRGDWYVGKGVACAKIRIGPGKKDIVEVFTTHLHAPYEPEPRDSYMCHRTAQAWEIAKLMKGAVDRGHLVLGLGDFNAIPLSLAHRIICTHGSVRDVWRVLHPDSSVGMALDLVEQARRRPIPTAQYNLTENGATCDSVLNTWRWAKREQKLLGPGRPPIEIPSDTMDPRAKRLDYIFASSGSRDGELGGWTIKDARVGMAGRHPILQCSLSDHFAVEATIEWHPAPYNPDPHKDEDVAVGSGAFLQSPTSSEHPSPVRDTFYNTQLKPIKEDAYLPIQTYDEILDLIAKYNMRERKQRRYRLYHFIASVIISIACLIAVWFSPRNFVAFLLMLLSTLGLSAGVIDGLIGGLFMGSEIRALKEFEWEIRNARAAAGAGNGGGEIEDPLQEW